MTTQGLQEIREHAADIRAAFLTNTIRLDQRQLLNQLETLGECAMEEESHEGRASTNICIAVVRAIGAFKYPTSWDAAVRERFIGDSCL